MSTAHEDIAVYLGHALANQLDRREFRVSVNGAKAHTSGCMIDNPLAKVAIAGITAAAAKHLTDHNR